MMQSASHNGIWTFIYLNNNAEPKKNEVNIEANTNKIIKYKILQTQQFTSLKILTRFNENNLFWQKIVCNFAVEKSNLELNTIITTKE